VPAGGQQLTSRAPWGGASALHEVLQQHPEVHEGNRDVVVEALRSIAELMIWGDQHDPSFFDFFAEHQTLGHFRRILAQPDNRGGGVAVQVLQTLSILIQNTRSEQAVYFLFSNNHLNAIVSQEFDIESDEVLAYYVSFLKTIAMKLNGETVQFFFTSAGGEGGKGRRFPLFSQALQFFAHEESMVRAAVRTLTLQVYALRDEEIGAFVCDGPEGAYFGRLGEHLRRSWLQSQKVAAAVGAGSIGAARLETDLDDLDDWLCYCSDIHSVGPPAVGAALAEGLWGGFLAQLVGGLEKVLEHADCPEALALPAPNQASADYIECLCGLNTLERVVQFLQVPGLMADLAAALLGPPPGAGEARAERSGGCAPLPLLAAAQVCLQSRDARLATALVGLLTALVGSAHVPRSTLASAGLLPQQESAGPGGAPEAEGGAGAGAVRGGEVGRRAEEGGQTSLEGPARGAGRSEGKGQGPSSGGGDEAGPRDAGDGGPRESGAAWPALLLPLLEWDLHPAVLVQVGWLAWNAQGRKAGGATCTPGGAEALEGAYRATLDAYLDEVDGPWCDGLPLLFTRAWNRHSYQMQRRGGPSTGLKVSDLTVPVSSAGPAGPAEAPGAAEGSAKQRSSSAAAARVHAGSERMAALRVVRAVLEAGSVPSEPPLGAAGLQAVTLGFPEGSQAVVPEGAALDLAGVEAIPCKVSFSQGAERNVLFVSRGHSSPPTGGVPGSPSVLLVEPTPAAQPSGRVVAMAPLAGAEPAVDPSHGHWLHVRIRPPLNALAQKGAPTPGGGRRGSKARYIDGRWTLAFSDEQGAARARDLVEENREALRGACAATLEALRHSSGEER